MEFGTRERWGATIAVTVLTLGGIGAWMNQRPHAVADDLPLPPTSVTASEYSATPKAIEFNAGEELPTTVTPSDTTTVIPSPSPTPLAKLLVHVSGAVKKPGVYQFKPGDRIMHAIKAAGGLKPNAMPDVHNEAAYLQDADNIHFPSKPTAASASPPTRPTHPLITRGTLPTTSRTTPVAPEPPRGRVLGKEPPTVAVVGATSSAESTNPGGEPSEGRSSKKSDKLRTPGEGTVNINTAEAAELMRLPGVGPAMATRILDYRQKIGKFNAPEQLKDVKGVGEKTFPNANVHPSITRALVIVPVGMNSIVQSACLLV